MSVVDFCLWQREKRVMLLVMLIMGLEHNDFEQTNEIFWLMFISQLRHILWTENTELNTLWKKNTSSETSSTRKYSDHNRG